MIIRNSLVLFGSIMCLLTGVSCTVSSKVVNNTQPIKEVSKWHCATKRGVGGGRPNITLVSKKPLTSNNDFCLKIMKNATSIANKKLSSINFNKIRSPYNLLNSIKKQGYTAIVENYIDYDGVHKTKVEIPITNTSSGKLTSARVRVAFISKENYNVYDKGKCLYKPIPIYSQLLQNKSEYYFVRCRRKGTSIRNTWRAYGKEVAHLKQ